MKKEKILLTKFLLILIISFQFVEGQLLTREEWEKIIGKLPGDPKPRNRRATGTVDYSAAISAFKERSKSGVGDGVNTLSSRSGSFFTETYVDNDQDLLESRAGSSGSTTTTSKKPKFVKASAFLPADPQQEKLFDDIVPADDDDFIELISGGLNHALQPEGYAFHPRTRLLEFYREDPVNSYPPFTYHGLYGPSKWHEIPWKNLLVAANRCFMLLDHTCENEILSRTPKSSADNKDLITGLVSCEEDEYPKLPKCDSDFQSPIHFQPGEFELDDTLQKYVYTNIDQEFDFLMSLPWDGTNLLTVELLDTEKHICDSLTYQAAMISFTRNLTPIVTNQNCQNQTSQQLLSTTKIKLIPEIQSGGVSGGTLYLERFYIKYGTDIGHGSEHMSNGTSYGMEFQFIFTKQGRQFSKPYWVELMEQYAKIESGQSTESEFGKNIHIISLLVKVVPNEEWKKGNNETNNEYNIGAVNEIAKLAAAARHFWTVHNRPKPYTNVPTSYAFKNREYRHRGFKSQTGGKAQLNLGKLLPPKKVRNDGKPGLLISKYYTYRGSITHPPCFEHIDYGVYVFPVYIPENLWESFVFIPSQFDDTRFVAGNYRPIETIYHRSTDLKFNRDREKVEKAKTRIKSRRIRKSNRSIIIELHEYDFYEYGAASNLKTFNYVSILICFVFFVQVILYIH